MSQTIPIQTFAPHSKLTDGDCERLQNQIDALALISENPPPVVTRVLFSEADRGGREFVKKLCQEAGLEVREDAIGNIFARWTGQNPHLPAVATGSHIDAIPNAGKFDGVVGVLGAIEAIRLLQQAGFNPKRSIELIVFTAEEPTRFGIGCVGSRMLAGMLSPEKAALLKDASGRTLQEWREKVGWNERDLNSVQLSKSCYSSFVELHIEQGPILDREKVAIGIVERIAAPSTLRLELTGAGGHAGGTLMPGRRDALLAGAEIALAVEKAALNSGSPDTVATTGVFQIRPGAVNSVPCHAHLEIDLRDTHASTRDSALIQIEQAVKKICQARQISFQLERVANDPPVLCDQELVGLASRICSTADLSSKRMVSRAYHDSSFMAQLYPTVMIFIPCRDGLSHRPDEYSSPEQIKAGVIVLANMLASLSDDI
jgi:N-carbamoyl-L-amino-acid hydrolase